MKELFELIWNMPLWLLASSFALIVLIFLSVTYAAFRVFFADSRKRFERMDNDFDRAQRRFQENHKRRTIV